MVLGPPKLPAKMALAMSAQLSAMTTLRKRPSNMRMSPSKAFAPSQARSFWTWGRRCDGRCIGPAIKCGNRLMKRA